MNKEDLRRSSFRNTALHHHQHFDGTGYPNLKQNEAMAHLVSKSHRVYKVCELVSGSEIPIEDLIVRLDDGYDALRSQEPNEEIFFVEESLHVMAGDAAGAIAGEQYYGEELWSALLEKHEVFDGISAATSQESKSLRAESGQTEEDTVLTPFSKNQLAGYQDLY